MPSWLFSKIDFGFGGEAGAGAGGAGLSSAFGLSAAVIGAPGYMGRGCNPSGRE